MALYDMTPLKGAAAITKNSLTRLERTTFATEGIQERAHLQAALRDHIELIDKGLLVIAEEFGDFEGVNRRIDLLCLDKDCELVVVELKRTADGGHMELQALRYAAMISTMTFSQVVRTFAKYRQNRGLEDHTTQTAEADLLTWLELGDDEAPAIPREVRIVLASEDFSQEITTTVLWLNEFHAFDIRCVRLTPYKLDSTLLLDVQHVIPLPEASSYTVRVREKESAVKQANDSAADWTKFIVQTPNQTTQPLPKRWAMLRLVEAMIDAGVSMTQVSQILPPSKTLKVVGTCLDADDLWAAVQAQYDKPDENRKRWHLADPIEDAGATWVLNNNWGTKTRHFFKQLLAVAPQGFAVYEEDAAPQSLD